MEGEANLNGDSADGANDSKPPGKWGFQKILMLLISRTSFFHVEPVGCLDVFLCVEHVEQGPESQFLVLCSQNTKNCQAFWLCWYYDAFS